jgi:hypothetical protein
MPISRSGFGSPGALRLLGEALLESDAVRLYPTRVVNSERAGIGELCLDVADAHRMGAVGLCVACGGRCPCGAVMEASRLGLEHVVLATAGIVRRWGPPALDVWSRS